ncbi:MAG: GH3 auxin-responsive promoter family protein, partial [Candidatus Omnitrophica bacterium]|nr:GH3 auxin-responsive promoter family protein [Candidatus Omnitrophota bacterium]
ADSKKALLTDIWSYYVVKDHPHVLDGKILVLISPQVEGYTESGISYGAESGHGYREISPFVRGLYALPYKVFEIEDYDARYYTILRMAMEKNVTTIATLNPNTISLLCQKIGLWQDRIIRDMYSGTLDAGFKIEKDIRRELEAVLRPNRKRSKELERIIAEKGELLPKYFWPDMALIECWKAGMMSMYLKELTKYFGEMPIRDMGCLSTEARSSIPMTDSGAGGVLAIETNFYEFIPKEDADKKDKRLLTCDRLEEAKEYFLVVTTAAGLYRYNIDDLVRVNGFFNKTPVIEFVQKGIGASSLAGEKLYESQVNDALNRALTRMSLIVEFFCALAEKEKGPRYSFLVEFSGTLPSPDGKKRFLYILEEELRKHNREYDFTRSAKLLGSPVLKVVRKGEFEKYRAKRIASGAHEGQFKAPELTRDSGFQNNFSVEEEIHLD